MTSPISGKSGFTLIELLVVLALMGAVLGLVAGHGPWRRNALDLRSAATEIAQGLRETRSIAIGGDRSAALTVNLSAHTYRVDKKAPRNLPKQYGLAVLTTTGEAGAGKEPGIRFDPDGGSTGGQITLEDGKRKVAVAIDWLTGRVRVIDAP